MDNLWIRGFMEIPLVALVIVPQKCGNGLSQAGNASWWSENVVFTSCVVKVKTDQPLLPKRKNTATARKHRTSAHWSVDLPFCIHQVAPKLFKAEPHFFGLMNFNDLLRYSKSIFVSTILIHPVFYWFCQPLVIVKSHFFMLQSSQISILLGFCYFTFW